VPPNSAAIRPLRDPRPSDLQRESVAGGVLGYVAQYARALPQHIDDVTADFGSDLYDRMSLDPQIAASLAVFKASILEDGVNVAPAIDNADDDGFELASQIADEAERVLDDLSTALDDVLWNMLDHQAQGNKLAELVYEMRAGITDGKARLQIAAIKVKPRYSYLFVVDAYENLVGILGRKPGMAAPAGGSSIIDTGNPPPDLLSPRKFAIATFRPKDGDPRGTSILRPAYDPWWRKRQALVEYVKYLAQFAGPSLWATLPEQPAVSGPPLDYLGNVLTDSNGDPQASTSALDSLLTNLQTFRNGTAAAFSYGTELHTIEMQGEGAAFLRAIGECNISMVKAILTQELATEEGEHQARAAAQVHQDVLDTLVRQGKRGVVRMLAKQVLQPWVRFNWGDKAAMALVPKPSLGTTEEVDRAPMINALANAMKSGLLHGSQLPEIDTMLGLPPRDLSQEPVIVESEQPQQPGRPPPEGQPAQDDQQQEADVPPDRVRVRPHHRGRPQRRQS
jgi:hypothetical protein